MDKNELDEMLKKLSGTKKLSPASEHAVPILNMIDTHFELYGKAALAALCMSVTMKALVLMGSTEPAKKEETQW